jgi:hypothetical protein
MGPLFRLVLTRFLPARFAWVVTAFILARAFAARRRTEPRRERTVRYYW